MNNKQLDTLRDSLMQLMTIDNDVESNAYNWAIANAISVVEGTNPENVIAMRDAMKNRNLASL